MSVLKPEVPWLVISLWTYWGKMMMMMMMTKILLKK